MHVTDMFSKERFMLTELQTDMVLPLGKYSTKLACIFFDSIVSPVIPTDTKKFIIFNKW